MKTIKNELQNLIFGNESAGKEESVKKIQLFLKRNAESGRVTSGEKHFKKQEEIALSEYITKEHLWFKSEVSDKNYITEGAEQKVYRFDDQFLIKLNDAIFYESWLDYFNSLLIHNYFFSTTRYDLMGFFKKNDIFYAVVKQRFIFSTELVNLKLVSEFLETNQFIEIRNNDYFNKEIGLILEDLHDENIISNNKILYFIDSVFYLTKEFYQ